MSAQIVRTIQVRSQEQYIYTNSYNRVSFQIAPDGLSTDLSQSYLKLQLSLVNLDNLDGMGQPQLLTWADFQNLAANHLAVSFGYGSQAYSPACLISTARLRARGTGEILEELPGFCNILTQTMFQLTNDFETLSSSTLWNGEALQTSGHASSLSAALSCFTQPNTEIHIPLRDIFGTCRHTDFDLSATGGLIMEFELDQTHSLFKIQTAYNQREIGLTDGFTGEQPEYDISGHLTFAQGPETSAPNILTKGAVPTNANKQPAFNDLLIQPLPNEPSLIQAPRDGFRWAGDSFGSLTAGFVASNSVSSLTIKTLAENGRYMTAEDMSACGFLIDNYLKLCITMTEPVTKTQKPFTVLARITSVVPSANPNVRAIINFAANPLYYRLVTWEYEVTLDHLEVLYDPGWIDPATYNPSPQDILEISGSVIDPIFDGNVMELTVFQLDQLARMGILNISGQIGVPSASVYQPTSNTFDLMIQTEDVSGSILTYDRVVGDGTNSRRVYSNQATKLAIEGKKVFVKSVVYIAGDPTGLVTLGNVDLNTNSGIQAGYEIVPGATLNVDQATYTLRKGAVPTYSVFFLNCQQSKSFYAYVSPHLSYSIAQFQVVLVQQTRQKPMTPLYTSFGLEVAMIETDLQQYSRQWILTAPNLYNGFFMLCDGTSQAGAGSLIAHGRGVANYRISINNIANTNRVVTVEDVTSQSPSSLHFDKLMTAFQNSEYVLRNLTGISTVADSDKPVITLPIKVYSGVVGGIYQQEPMTMGATVQLDLYGSPKPNGDTTIKQGPIIFFKQSIRALAQGLGQMS
tara:strand:+ start:2059 stop:4464 length:2406 start_codon:yes stop_codon:yes gene_type:complete